MMHKRDWFVKSIAELCQMFNGLFRLLYKKSVKYDALVISAGLAVSAVIVSIIVQIK